MGTLLSILAFLIVISIIVVIHEGGHYLVAKAFGIKVKRFSLGMGKVICKFRKWDTEFAVSLLPIGGYVSFDEADSSTLTEKEKLQYFKTTKRTYKAAVAIAGPVANFVLALVLFWILGLVGVKDVAPTIDVVEGGVAQTSGVYPRDKIISVNGTAIKGLMDFNSKITEEIGEKTVFVRFERASGGTHDVAFDLSNLSFSNIESNNGLVINELGIIPWTSLVIKKTIDGSPAQKAGLQPGDTIFGVNGETLSAIALSKKIASFEPVTLNIQDALGNYKDVVIVGEPKEIEKDGKKEVIPFVGVQMQSKFDFVEVTYGPIEAISHSFRRLASLIDLQVDGLAAITKGETSAENLAGPVGIAGLAGGAIKAGITAFLEFIAIISIAIGFMNLIPIPALDGGQLVILLLEGIRGKSFSDKTIENIGIVSFVILAILAIFVTYNDIGRIMS